jgi:ubiquinone biosynthesis protein UbiJ
LNQLISQSLTQILNHAWHQNPPSLSLLKKLAGKVIQLELNHLDLCLTLFPDIPGITILSDYKGEVDVRITGAPFSLLRLLLQEQPLLANNPSVSITGEIGTAQQLLELFRELNPDWEEQIAQWWGEMPAHYLTSSFRQVQEYTQDRFNTLQFNLREYLQEEARHLPNPLEMEVFLDAIDTLRDDLERLEQRIQRLTVSS